MLILTSKTPWRRRPSGLVEIDLSSPQAQGLIAAYPLTPQCPHDLVQRRAVTLVGSPTYTGNPDHGMTLTTNGSSQGATAAHDLTGVSDLIIAFWLYIGTDGATNQIVLEHSANYASTTGSFVVDARASSTTCVVGMRGATNVYWTDSFPRPSLSVWHHYTMLLRRSVPINGVWVDGIAQTLTTVSHTLGAGSAFGNLTTYMMSRNNTSLWANERLTEVRLLNAATSAPASTLAASLYDPSTRWSLYQPLIRRTYLDVGGAPPSGFNPAWARRTSPMIGTGLR